jgi:hypothetical protein
MRYVGCFLAMLTIHTVGYGGEPLLGKLSEKYESGGRGPATVSAGVGDPGGVSYGTYQLASKIGRADEFVRKYYAEEIKHLKGGTPEFTKKWKELAEKDPTGLHKNEHDFIKQTHFDPQTRKLKKELDLDVEKRSAALRDVVWSTAVQHGPNTNVIVQAAGPLLAEKIWGDGSDKAFIKAWFVISDEALIRAVYAERGRKSADGKLVHFSGVSPEWIPALSKRLENEVKDAINMLQP